MNSCKKALQLVVDGSEPEASRRDVRRAQHARARRQSTRAKVFEGMGIYSPTLGIIGAVLGSHGRTAESRRSQQVGSRHRRGFHRDGLWHRLRQPVLPAVASKLKAIIQRQTQFREMMIDGMLCIAQGENPRIIEAKLQGYLH